MKRAALLLIVLTALCSGAVGFVGAKNLSPSIVTVRPAACPAPQRPELPALDAALPLDHPANVEALMVRDDALRAYILGLESSLECYREQAP